MRLLPLKCDNCKKVYCDAYFEEHEHPFESKHIVCNCCPDCGTDDNYNEWPEFFELTHHPRIENQTELFSNPNAANDMKRYFDDLQR